MRVSWAAILALSKSGFFVLGGRVDDDTISGPGSSRRLYQKRSPVSSQWGVTAVSKTSLPTLAGVQREARS